MDWLIVSSNAVPDAATFTGLAKYPEDFKLTNCEPLKAGYPADVELRMDADFPNDIELVESLYSSNNPLIVNEKVTELFASAGVDNVELLPVNVINHKGKRVKPSYFIINILTCVDCIDLDQSVFEYNSIDPDSICFLEKLVLDPERLPTKVKLFRPKHMQQIMLMHRTLVQELEADGARGFIFQEASEYSYP